MCIIDVVYEIFSFLEIQELAVIHDIHPDFRYMLTKIPRQPTFKTNRPYLKFTIAGNQRPIIITRDSPESEKISMYGSSNISKRLWCL